MNNDLHEKWVQSEVSRHGYWFQKIALPGIVTPGWQDPAKDKVPHFGLPDDMTGMRVLDVGCSEGFFSFEAERRGAREVVAIDSSPDSVQRFNVCKTALRSQANAYLLSVYDLNPRVHGTFDLVMFYGVLYHLRHPLLAIEKVKGVCSNTLLFQTHHHEEERHGDVAYAQFFPFGHMSGTKENPIFDPTVLWVPNAACCKGMLEHVGFKNVEQLNLSAGAVFRAEVENKSPGAAADPVTLPGC